MRLHRLCRLCVSTLPVQVCKIIGHVYQKVPCTCKSVLLTYQYILCFPNLKKMQWAIYLNPRYLCYHWVLPTIYRSYRPTASRRARINNDMFCFHYEDDPSTKATKISNKNSTLTVAVIYSMIFCSWRLTMIIARGGCVAACFPITVGNHILISTSPF